MIIGLSQAIQTAVVASGYLKRFSAHVQLTTMMSATAGGPPPHTLDLTTTHMNSGRPRRLQLHVQQED